MLAVAGTLEPISTDPLTLEQLPTQARTERVGTMGRKIAAVFVGIVIGASVNMAIVLVSAMLHPMPDGMEFNDPDNVRHWIEQLPVSGFLMALLAHHGGTLAGAFATAVVARRKWIAGGVIIGAFFLIGGVMNLLQLPHPAWFAPLDLLLYIPAGIAGAALAARCFPADTATTT